ncbi:MAG: GspH/FimT family pseudopilin [Patescibacteria group bacterium]
MNKGFTLWEILTVIAIIAVMAGVSLPAYQQFKPTLKLNAEARQLASDLRYAQQMAITEQTEYYLIINTEDKSYMIVKYPSQTIQSHSLDSISFGTITGLTADKAGFTATGAAKESGAIILTNGEDTKTVEIKPSGYVKTF